MYVLIYGIILIIVLAFLVPIIGLNVIFLILGAAIAFAIFKRNTELKKNIYKVDEKELNVLNLDKGGIFKLTGVGANLEELNLKVLAKHLYQEGDFYWYELECDKGDGEKVWVEIEDDDETTLSIVVSKLTLPDVGLTKQRLDDIDEKESGRITFNGNNYNYSESDEATFYRFCDDKKPEKFYYWDFAYKKWSISVEKWGDKDYEVFYSQTMLPSQITVFSNSSEQGE